MYMALDLHFEPEVSYRDLIVPLLSIPFLKIVGVVGTHYGTSDWIIAGYDVEGGIQNNHWFGGPKAVVQIQPEFNDDKHLKYLQEMTRLIHKTDKEFVPNISPFEVVPTGKDFTQIEAAVSVQSFDKILDWTANHATRLLIYPSVKLALKYDNAQSEQWVYRSNYVKEPLLEINISPRVKEKVIERMTISFTTTSGVWLRDNFDVGLPTGIEESDANLAMFAELAKVVYRANQSHYRDGMLDLDGNPFTFEYSHLHALLADIPEID